jgi:hypothetical protein
MPGTDEHDDDLEPEVNEGEIETMNYADEEELEEGQPEGEGTSSIGRAIEQAPPRTSRKKNRKRTTATRSRGQIVGAAVRSLGGRMPPAQRLQNP